MATTLTPPLPPHPTQQVPAPDAGTQPGADTASPAPLEPAAAPPQTGRRDPRWVRPTFWGLIALTAVLYLWDLAASEWANSFYAAAVQAGSVSWKALFFGCSDMACSITVDKPPASLWVMGLSAHIFGFNAWSMLVPQALMGAAGVGLVFAAVKRVAGPVAGLIAGVALALTPVACLMFRFNNPDALLTLLLCLAAYATVRAIEKGSTWWLVLAGCAVGFGFLTKMLQAFLVLPALVIAFFIAAPTPWRKRLISLLAACGAMIVSAGWYVAIVELMPAASRPYIGGSTTNSLLQLTLGYNGINRITGNATGSMGAGGGMGGGYAGITRLWGTDMGGQIAWLLGAALIFLVVGLALTARRPRTDARRASYLIWGGWLLVTALVFSFMDGIIHAYYTVALAPAIAALVGLGSAELWRRRAHLWARGLLAAAVAVTAVTAWVLLGRTPTWHPELRWIVAGLSLVAVVGLLVASGSRGPLGGRRWVARAVAVTALAAGLLGPAAYTLATVTQPHTGSIPSAGPQSSGMGGMGPSFQAGNGGNAPFPGGLPGGSGMQGGPGSQNGAGSQGSTGTQGSSGTQNGMGAQGGPAGTMGAPGGPGGGGGSFLDASQASSEMIALLTDNGSQYSWVAAVTGSNAAAGLQLSTGYSVMPIGGFNGGDDSPTLEQFQQWVAEGRIHYYVESGMGSGMHAIDGSNSPTQIQSWVEQNFTAQTVGNTTVYDLTQAPASPSADAAADTTSTT